MDSLWLNLNLEQRLNTLIKVPVRVANDVDIQGYGDVIGKGIEVVITLGTGADLALIC